MEHWTLNLGFLLPVALLVATAGIPVATGLLIAYAPLVWLAFHFKAGAPAESRKHDIW